ncbi:hypothetical protein NQ314_006822 [Rhamnusium bicolor]|uniref:Uncharacterized protein n=1 Tax=Rhamnusium bicolor TaxID=1586634 RepID=A0AAV8YYW3_9CUCU|nr:hypothetical protein NQ314_006822 [Rhamnusium bicolor]
MQQRTKQRVRFTDHDDLTLLREVLGQNPIENPAVWAIIQENMLSVTKKNFSVRSLREHLELLIKLWLKEFKTLKNLKKGLEARDKFASSSNDYGQEYESSEDAPLLDFQDLAFIEKEPECVVIDQEISLDEYNYFSTKKNYEDIQNGNSNEVDLIQGLAYLEAYDKNQHENKKKELDLEERRLALEERRMTLAEKQHSITEYEIKKKFELEEKKLDLEVEFRKDLTKIVERQERLIHFIVNKNN